MLKLFNSFFLGNILFSSLLCAATVNFPIDQPVVQASEFFYVYSSTDRYTRILEKLQTVLTLKNCENQVMDFEAFYQNILYQYQHDNDILGSSRSVNFNSKNPDNKYPEYLKSWNQISEQTNVITVTSDLVTSSEKQSPFLTYGNHSIYQGAISSLQYLSDKNLNVGDAFQVHCKGANWEYEITGIDNVNVSYQVNVTDGTISGQGQGIWNIENGLLGQLNLSLRSGTAYWTFKVSSVPQ